VSFHNKWDANFGCQKIVCRRERAEKVEGHAESIVKEVDGSFKFDAPPCALDRFPE
jgi:hypothetical protein